MTRTTPLHPQLEGMVERFIWTLGQELTKYCSAGQSDQDWTQPVLLMTYRSAVHESMRQPPAKVMFRHELQLTVDLLSWKQPEEDLPKEAFLEVSMACLFTVPSLHHVAGTLLKG